LKGRDASGDEVGVDEMKDSVFRQELAGERGLAGAVLAGDDDATEMFGVGQTAYAGSRGGYLDGGNHW
jgi:hypothetical protein